MTVPRLEQALKNLERRTLPGGLVVVEPFISPDDWRDGSLHAAFVNQPDLKLARMNINRREGHIGVIDFHFLVATPAGIEFFTERHDLALFTHDEYLGAFAAAGLNVTYDSEGLAGRGLYLGVKPDR